MIKGKIIWRTRWSHTVNQFRPVLLVLNKRGCVHSDPLPSRNGSNRFPFPFDSFGIGNRLLPITAVPRTERIRVNAPLLFILDKKKNSGLAGARRVNFDHASTGKFCFSKKFSFFSKTKSSYIPIIQLLTLINRHKSQLDFCHELLPVDVILCSSLFIFFKNIFSFLCCIPNIDSMLKIHFKTTLRSDLEFFYSYIVCIRVLLKFT